MRKFAVFAASLAAASMLACLTSCAGEKIHFAEEEINFNVENINPADTDMGKDIGESKNTDYHNLSLNGTVSLKGDLGGENNSIETEILKTNSCEISVKNNGKDRVRICLYSEENNETPIREMDVDAGKTKIIDGLTSRLLYHIAVSAAGNAAVDITIGD